jgi:hypothetical protein
MSQPPRRRARSRPAAVPRPAARRSGRHQGHHRRRRPADDVPFAHPGRQHRHAPTRSWWRSCARAGAIVMGKLSTHEFAIGGPSFDLPFPPARNPVEPEASSRRLVVRVSARASPPGCSRWRSAPTPADRCAIRRALRHRRVEADLWPGLARGVFPLSFTLDHVGPMTRTVADNALLLDAIAGHDPPIPAARRQRRATSPRCSIAACAACASVSCATSTKVDLPATPK